MPGHRAGRRSTSASSRARLLKCIAFDVDGELGLALVPGDREVNEYALAAALAPTRGAPATPTRTSPRTPSCRRATSARTTRASRSSSPTRRSRAPHRLGHRRERARPPRAQRGARPRLHRRRLGRSRHDRVRRRRARAAGKPLSVDRGIEVGHVFQLGTKYSEALDARYTDENGEQHPMVMGCYGIGISRIVAAVVEEYHDDARARVAGRARAVRRPPDRAARPRRRAAEVVAAAERSYDELQRARRRRALRRPRRAARA